MMKYVAVWAYAVAAVAFMVNVVAQLAGGEIVEAMLWGVGSVGFVVGGGLFLHLSAKHR